MTKISIHSMYRQARQEQANMRCDREKAIAEYRRRSVSLGQRDRFLLLVELCEKYNFKESYLSSFVM